MTQEFISTQEAAKRLGIHVSTVRGWIRDGRLPAYRVGQRFTRVEWSEALASIAKPVATPREAGCSTCGGIGFGSRNGVKREACAECGR